MLKKVFKILCFILGISVGFICLFTAVLTLTDYKPQNTEVLAVKNSKADSINKNKVFSITSYNISHCLEDKDQDFFMEGGKVTNSISKEKTMENLKGVSHFLEEEKADFVFVQEVDLNSTRSHNVNEYDFITKSLDNYSNELAYNNKILWKMSPIEKPEGKVNSGMMTLSKYYTTSASRYKLPGNEVWPQKIVGIDWCFIENRVPVKDGKELVLVNCELPSYEVDKKVKEKQLEFLKNYIKKEYKKGNYIIVGGDWNGIIPGTDTSQFNTAETIPTWLENIPTSFKPQGFKWATDETTPTVRSLDIPYKKDVNFVSILDGFLVSPNVEIRKVKTYPLDFKYSNHNPVTGYFILK